MSIRRFSSKLTVRDSDPLVSEHRVQDIHILPGVSLLDVTYKVLKAARIDIESVVLRDILFHEPVVTNAEIDRKLTVTVDHEGDRGRVSVTSVPWKGEQAVSEKETSHMTCHLLRSAPVNIQSIPGELTLPIGEAVDLDACYSVTRRIGIFHDGFMKCLGQVGSLPSGDVVAAVSLSDRAYVHRADFVLHPVFLDCSTIVPLFPLRNAFDESILFIPFAIEEFRARSLANLREVRIRVEKPDPDIAGREILHHSFSIHHPDGRLLARFRKFGVKRVRSLESIRRLLARSTARIVPPPLTVAPPPPVSEAPTGDPVLDAIGALIQKHGGIDWNEEAASKPFFDLGLDSVALLDMSEALEKELNVRLYPTLLFERSTAAALAGYLRETFPAECAAAGGDARPVSAEEVKVAKPVLVPLPAEIAAEAPEIFIPRWLSLGGSHVAAAGNGKAIALLGAQEHGGLVEHLAKRLDGRVSFSATVSANSDAIADFRAALERGLAFDELWLVGGAHDFAFALVKTLIAAGRFQSPLVLKALTFNCFQVHHEAVDAGAGHGLWGLLQSTSREYPSVRVSLLDLDRDEVAQGIRGEATDLLPRIEEFGARARELRALRGGRLYERRLLGTRPSEVKPQLLRQGGVYLVIGGAGGVGMELVRHLRQSYGARVAICGRRSVDAQLQQKLSAFGEYGKDILYLQAAVDDEAALSAALRQVRERFGELNGIVHSAMVLDDRRLPEMDPDSFARVLRPKVDGVEVLARVSDGLELDFLVFFSSIQSFLGNVSQGNYAAASTFLDGFAASLRAKRSYPVVVINWGFWSEVGAVATDVYRSLLARQGLHGLRGQQALAALEQVLAAGWEQAAIVAAEEPVLEEMGISRSVVLERSASREAVVPVQLSIEPEYLAVHRSILEETSQAMEALLPLARRRIVQVLRDLGVVGAGANASADSAVGRISAEHARLVRAILFHLEAAQALEGEGLGEQAFSDALIPLGAAHPSLRPLVPLLQASIGNYPEILSGRKQAAEVIFPRGSVELVRPVYGDSNVSFFYNKAVANLVRALGAAQAHRPLRVLEVGAGTGSTAVEVLLALEDAGIESEYLHTDLWDRLINDAKRRLGSRFPKVRFRVLDIGSDPRMQGLGDEFDLVIATNVLHATRDLHATLQHVKRLLRRGGTLVLNESIETQEFSTYTFGLLPGWWNAADPSERLPLSPLASADTWSTLLKDEGFVQVRTLIPDDAAPSLRTQQIFAACSDGEVRVRGDRRPAVLEAVKQRKLPPALADKLRPLDLPALTGEPGPTCKHIALFQDPRESIWIFLDNPPANTFTSEMLEELCGVLKRLSELAPNQLRKRFIYLTHFGEYFSLGGDRSELVDRLAAGDHLAVVAFAERAAQLLRLLSSLDALVVGVVNGTAQGGGLETLLATDLQLVREGVQLGLPEIKSGLIPGMGGLTYLKRLIGLPRAKRVVMLGELLSAREAEQLGLISHVVDDAFSAALGLPEKIQSVETALYMKRVLNREKAEQLTADIEEWVAYMLRHTEWINTRRIADSRMMLMSRAAQNAR